MPTGEYEAGLSGQTRGIVSPRRRLAHDRRHQPDGGLLGLGAPPRRRRPSPILKQFGFRSPLPSFVPVWALQGINLTSGSQPIEGGLEWFRMPRLVDEIDAIAPCHRASRVGTRMCVSEVL